MIDPKDFALTLGNPVATHEFIKQVNKEFQEMRAEIAALKKLVEKQAEQDEVKTSKKAVKTA